MHRSLRTHLVATILLLSSVSVGAQVSTHPLHRGTWILGGSGTISSFRDVGNDSRYTVVELLPTALFFVSPHVALGASSALSYANGGGGHVTTLSIGPTLNYFFGAAPSRLLPFVGLRGAAGRTRYTSENQSQTNTDLTVDGSVGITYLLVPHVGLNGAAYYRRTHSRVRGPFFDGSNDSEDFGLRFGFSAFVFR
jgi:hypothetical protein